MATSTKRRMTRIGAKHRQWITIEKGTFEMLLASGERLGYSVSALANRVIIRGVAAGLIDDPIPTQAEHREKLYEELCRLHERHTKVLLAKIDLKDQMLDDRDQLIATQHEELCKYETTLYGPYEGDQTWRDEQAKIKRETAG